MYSFPLSDTEEIIKKGHASLHLEDSAFTGAFYLTSERLVFVGYVMDITRKYMEEVPLDQVKGVRGEKTFYIIPNVLGVSTIAGKKLKIIVDPGARDAWLKAIDEQLKKL
ncbi:hypothetical protein [Anaeroselena agilis]|uniref:GRAM domain-containing protein n=1 Tax=Anaeroselena agilis TaxID=3063788 RepID=A0ABU3NVX7_9FIRM|nr:hypothetical protein [Selenomonadales bacterium 4137-cl]